LAESYRIAVIPGDGIGKEVVSIGIDCLKTIQELLGSIMFELVYFPWGSEFFLKHGKMMPDDGLKTLAEFQAIPWCRRGSQGAGSCHASWSPDPHQNGL